MVIEFFLNNIETYKISKFNREIFFSFLTINKIINIIFIFLPEYYINSIIRNSSEIRLIHISIKFYKISKITLNRKDLKIQKNSRFHPHPIHEKRKKMKNCPYSQRKIRKGWITIRVVK